MYLVLNVSSYNFVNNDGERVAGQTVYASDEPIYKDNNKGLQVVKFNLASDSFIEFTSVPAYYDLDIGMKPVGGKAQAVIKSAMLAKPLHLDFTKK